jgi:hypothetical protein
MKEEIVETEIETETKKEVKKERMIRERKNE